MASLITASYDRVVMDRCDATLASLHDLWDGKPSSTDIFGFYMSRNHFLEINVILAHMASSNNEFRDSLKTSRWLRNKEGEGRAFNLTG